MRDRNETMDEMGPLQAVPVPPKRRRVGRPPKDPIRGPRPKYIKKTNVAQYHPHVYPAIKEYATRSSKTEEASLFGPIDLENLLKKNRKRTSKPLTHNSISHKLPSVSASCDSIPLEVENISTERDIDAEEMLDTQPQHNVNQTEETGGKFVTEPASARIQKLEEQVEKLTNKLRAFKELKTREEETAVQNANLESCVQEMYKQNDQEQETFQIVGYKNCNSAETEEEQPQEGTEEEYFQEITNYDYKNADDHFEIVYEDSKYDKTEADFGVEDQMGGDESQGGCKSCLRRR